MALEDRLPSELGGMRGRVASSGADCGHYTRLAMLAGLLVYERSAFVLFLLELQRSNPVEQNGRRRYRSAPGPATVTRHGETTADPEGRFFTSRRTLRRHIVGSAI